MKLTQQQALAVYRMAFPDDAGGFSREEARAVTREMNGVVNIKDIEGGVHLRAYNFANGDSPANAAARIREAARKIKEEPSSKPNYGGVPHMGIKVDDNSTISISGLRAVRIRRGITQNQLGRMIGCSSTTVSAVELGKAPIQPWMAQAICNVLGCDLAELSGYVKISLKGEAHRSVRTQQEEAA